METMKCQQNALHADLYIIRWINKYRRQNSSNNIQPNKGYRTMNGTHYSFEKKKQTKRAAANAFFRIEESAKHSVAFCNIYVDCQS